MTGNTKRCSKCGEMKPREAFGIDKRNRSGLRSECNACRNEYAKKRRKDFPEVMKAADRKYRTTHAEKLREYRREAYARDRDAYLERSRKNYLCGKSPSCKVAENWQGVRISFICEVCGTEFRRLKSQVDSQYRNLGSLPKFCSKSCHNASMRRNYKSPYARKIERIKKGVGS